MTETKFAFFDFDNTLAKGDSILPYLTFCVKNGVASWRIIPASIIAYIRWRMHPEFAAGAKEVSLSFMKGRRVEDMDDLARTFFQSKMVARVFAQARIELERLRSEGYRIVVVSASPDVYMRVLPEFLPVDAVLATQCEVNKQGCYSGKVGHNCKGEEKIVRIQAYLAETGETIHRAHSCAYGDSPSDAPMLQLTNHPTLVNPKKKLIKLLPDAPQLAWQ